MDKSGGISAADWARSEAARADANAKAVAEAQRKIVSHLRGAESFDEFKQAVDGDLDLIDAILGRDPVHGPKEQPMKAMDRFFAGVYGRKEGK